METWVLFPSVSSLCSTEHLFAFGVRTGSPLHLVGHWDCHLYENPFYCSSLSNALSKICPFYLRWWWGGSEWGRRDLDCRWYLSYLRLSVHWILLNIASAISTPHIKVSEKKNEVCSVSQDDMLHGIPLVDGPIEVDSELSEDLAEISSQESS